MSLERLEDGAFDFVLLLSQELLGGRLEEIGVLHDLDLRDPGHGERHTLGSLHALADGVQSHHLEKTETIKRLNRLSWGWDNGEQKGKSSRQTQK